MIKSYVVMFTICLLGASSIISFMSFLQKKENSSRRFMELQDNHPLREDKYYNGPQLKLEKNMKVKTLWPDDEDCNDLTVRFPVRVPIVFLASFPRSGNTWTRYMLEAASGIFSGSVYADKYLSSLGYEGEELPWASGKVLPIKTHSLSDKLTEPAILIIRNPVEAIISYWSYIRGHLDMTFVAPEDEYKSPEFHRFVSQRIRAWEKLYIPRLNVEVPLLVVFYENLKENPLVEVTRMLDFMGIEVNNHRLNCLSKHIEGPVKRERPKYMDYLSEQEKLMIRTSMARVAVLAERLGTSLPKVFSDAIN